MAKKRDELENDVTSLELETEESSDVEVAVIEEEGSEESVEMFAGEEETSELDAVVEEAVEDPAVDVEGTELGEFEAAEIEDVEFIEDERIESIIESILFASDRPTSLGALKLIFKGTNVRTDRIKRTLEALMVEYAGGRRGVTLEEVPGGWQLRTKVDNMDYLRRTLKQRPFRLSGPALEVLSIIAYKQPCIKHEVDEIRGVESGHLLRALMEKNLVSFVGKSDLPGRPMTYGTTRRFLEIFGLRNLKELPTLSQIDELLPEGIGEEEEIAKPTLSSVTDSMASQFTESSFSAGEEELGKIQEQLESISTSSEFFEKEKLRQRQMRDNDRAANIRDALAVGEDVPTRDLNWLKKFDEALAAGTTLAEIEENARTARFANMKSGEAPAGAAANEENMPSADAVTEGSPSADEAHDLESASFEDAEHPEDELGEEMADIDGEEHGDAGL